MLSKEVNIK